MATKIETLEKKGDIILPRTVSKAVTMEDGTSLEYAYKNSSSDYVKIPAEVATALGLVEGASLSEVLVGLNTNLKNTLASAELI